jgi:acyl dehydratase
MLEVEFAKDLARHIGLRLGPTDWLSIDQGSTDAFAALTGDDHWIHIDTARALAERPDRRTIVHGLHILSLIPKLQRSIYRIRRRGHGLNYGYDRVRFISPVPVGSKMRMSMKFLAVENHWSGSKLTLEAAFEIADADRPVLIAHNILVIADEAQNQKNEA